MSNLEALKSRARRAFDEEYARIYGELPPIEQRAEMKAQYSEELLKLNIQNSKFKQQNTKSAAEIQKTREASQSRVREQIIESQGVVDAARTEADAKVNVATINQESKLAQQETLGLDSTKTKNDEYTAKLYGQSWNTPADTAQPPDDYIKEYFDAGPTGGNDGTPQKIQQDMATLDAGQASIYKYNAYHSNRQFHIQNLSAYLTDPSVDPSVQQQRKDAFERQHKSNIQTTKPELQLTQQEIDEAGRREDSAAERLDRLDAASSPSGRPRYRNDYSDWTGQQDKSIDGTLDRFAKQKGDPGLDTRIAATEEALANVDKPQLTEYGQWLQGYKKGDAANKGFYTRMVGGTPEEAGLFYAENPEVFEYMKKVKQSTVTMQDGKPVSSIVSLLGVDDSNRATASVMGEGDEVDPIRALRAQVAKELLPSQFERFIGKGMGERRFKRIVKRAGKKAAKKSPSTRTLDYGEPMSMSYGQPKIRSKTQELNDEKDTQAAVQVKKQKPKQKQKSETKKFDILGEEDAENAIVEKLENNKAANDADINKKIEPLVTYTLVKKQEGNRLLGKKPKFHYEGSDGTKFRTFENIGSDLNLDDLKKLEEEYGMEMYDGLPPTYEEVGVDNRSFNKTDINKRQAMMSNKLKGKTNNINKSSRVT